MDKNYVPSGGQNDKLDQLITVIEKVMDRYENIESKLDNKCDMSDVTKLEERIKLLEYKVLKHESDTSHKLVTGRFVPKTFRSLERNVYI